MKNIWKWVLIFVGVFLVALFIALPIFGRAILGTGIRYGGFPMMDHHFGWNILGGSHMFVFSMFGGGLWMLGRFLFPILLIVLIVLAVLALLRKPKAGEVVSANTIPCPHCGKQIQNNWVACPYCGEKTQ
jgi:hypothetical protein